MSKDPSIEIRRPKARGLDEFVGSEGAPAAAPAPAPAVAAKTTKAPKLAKGKNGKAGRAGGAAADAPRIRGIATRSKGEAKGRLTVYVPLDVAAKLRRHCFEHAIDLTDECAKAISEYVRRLPG
jgi:hypothetical protein